MLVRLNFASQMIPAHGRCDDKLCSMRILLCICWSTLVSAVRYRRTVITEQTKLLSYIYIMLKIFCRDMFKIIPETVGYLTGETNGPISMLSTHATSLMQIECIHENYCCRIFATSTKNSTRHLFLNIL